MKKKKKAITVNISLCVLRNHFLDTPSHVLRFEGWEEEMKARRNLWGW
jgi:hypothetical protein